MNAEAHLHLTSFPEGRGTPPEDCQRDQQALNTAGDLADDLEALLHEADWPTTSEQAAGES